MRPTLRNQYESPIKEQQSMTNILEFGNKSKVFDEISRDNKPDPYKVIGDSFLYIDHAKSKVLDTYRNLEFLLNKFNAIIKYNLMTRQREISLPGYKVFADDAENSCLSFVHFLATVNGMPIKFLDNHLDFLAFKNPYHPVIENVLSKKWDGIPRLDKFTKTLKTMDIYYPIIKTWMVCAIAAAFSEHGFINQGVLVLQGSQGIGKTRWVKALDPTTSHAVKEGSILDPGNKDSILLFARHWILEIGELDATFRKADIARLKSFITMEADDARLPYARKNTRLARRSVYVATVNDENFLADDTGNRRWWTIPIESIDLEHGLDMQQVWAEVYDSYVKGHLTYLSKDLQESINQSNELFEKTDPYEESILYNYNWESNTSCWRWLNATAIMQELGLKYENKSDAIRFGKILKQLSAKIYSSNKIAGIRISRGLRQYKIPLFNYRPINDFS